MCVCVCCVCVCGFPSVLNKVTTVVWGLICVLCLKVYLVYQLTYHRSLVPSLILVYQLTYHRSLVPSLILPVTVAYLDFIVNSFLHIVCHCLQVADRSCNLLLTQYYFYQEITKKKSVSEYFVSVFLMCEIHICRVKL